jgi:thioester reductase-like protein
VNAELRAFLAARLPAYMIPSGFVLMNALPMTASGKVDRRGLPEAAMTTATPPGAYAAPRSETERTVAAIWAEMLGVERVGVHDSFFELGGHSLLAAQLLARIERRFAKPLSLRRLFESPTVAGISAAIDSTGGGEPAADVVRLQADARLDPSIRPEGGAPAGDAGCIFLTGATGFLGTSLLAELLRASGADVHCLVRARDERHGSERLHGALEAFSLSDESFAERIVAVPGDLSKPFLGLSVEQFERLSMRIDAIYHCGATVSAVQPYTALRDVNVLGTREVLRFACHGKAKTLHHISTLAVWASPAYANLNEIGEDADAADCGGLSGGYTQSKWVAERLVLAARARGLAVCVYRPGLVTGHSVTGLCKTDDLTLAAARVCIDRKILPAVEASLDLLPVDYVGRAIVHLSRRAESRGRAFHLFNHQPMSWAKFGEWLRGEGYELRPVAIDEIGRDASSLAPLRMLFGLDVRPDHAMPRLDDRNTREGLRDASISCPGVDEGLLRTYLSYFTGSGLIEIATGKPESLPVPPD